MRIQQYNLATGDIFQSQVRRSFRAAGHSARRRLKQDTEHSPQYQRHSGTLYNSGGASPTNILVVNFRSL